MSTELNKFKNNQFVQLYTLSNMLICAVETNEDIIDRD